MIDDDNLDYLDSPHPNEVIKIDIKGEADYQSPSRGKTGAPILIYAMIGLVILVAALFLLWHFEIYPFDKNKTGDRQTLTLTNCSSEDDITTQEDFLSTTTGKATVAGVGLATAGFVTYSLWPKSGNAHPETEESSPWLIPGCVAGGAAVLGIADYLWNGRVWDQTYMHAGIQKVKSLFGCGGDPNDAHTKVQKRDAKLQAAFGSNTRGAGFESDSKQDRKRNLRKDDSFQSGSAASRSDNSVRSEKRGGGSPEGEDLGRALITTGDDTAGDPYEQPALRHEDPDARALVPAGATAQDLEQDYSSQPEEFVAAARHFSKIERAQQGESLLGHDFLSKQAVRELLVKHGKQVQTICKLRLDNKKSEMVQHEREITAIREQIRLQAVVHCPTHEKGGVHREANRILDNLRNVIEQIFQLEREIFLKGNDLKHDTVVATANAKILQLEQKMQQLLAKDVTALSPSNQKILADTQRDITAKESELAGHEKKLQRSKANVTDLDHRLAKAKLDRDTLQYDLDLKKAQQDAGLEKERTEQVKLELARTKARNERITQLNAEYEKTHNELGEAVKSEDIAAARDLKRECEQIAAKRYLVTRALTEQWSENKYVAELSELEKRHLADDERESGKKSKAIEAKRQVIAQKSKIFDRKRSILEVRKELDGLSKTYDKAAGITKKINVRRSAVLLKQLANLELEEFKDLSLQDPTIKADYKNACDDFLQHAKILYDAIYDSSGGILTKPDDNKAAALLKPAEDAEARLVQIKGANLQ